MVNYRITKYDPEKRNHKGHYLDRKDWISISCLGDSEYNLPNYEAYEKTETAYVEAVLTILHEKEIDQLKVEHLELHATAEDFENHQQEGILKNLPVDFESEIATLKNGTVFDLKKIRKIIRLILRETLWMELYHPTIKITFGYDYYMYVKCPKLKEHTIKCIEKMGLFVEPNIGRPES